MLHPTGLQRLLLLGGIRVGHVDGCDCPELAQLVVAADKVGRGPAGDGIKLLIIIIINKARTSDHGCHSVC